MLQIVNAAVNVGHFRIDKKSRLLFPLKKKAPLRSAFKWKCYFFKICSLARNVRNRYVSHKVKMVEAFKPLLFYPFPLMQVSDKIHV